MDASKTIIFFWGPAYFQVRTVSFMECTIMYHLNFRKNPILQSHHLHRRRCFRRRSSAHRADGAGGVHRGAQRHSDGNGVVVATCYQRLMLG